MSGRIASWCPDIERAHRLLNELPARAVILDGHGDAWQCGGVGRVGMFWYRAFGDGDGISSLQLAQIAGAVTVISPGEAS